MESVSQHSQADANEELVDFIVEQVKAGIDKQAIVAQLVEAGTPHEHAAEAVDTLYPEVLRLADEEEPTSSDVFQAAIGGVLAALIAGMAWAAIVVYTGYELGFAAWGIGFVAGWSVVYLGRGKRGASLQMTAALSSVVGIMLGKYFTFYHYFREAIREDFGHEIAAQISLFSSVVFQIVFENIAFLFSGYDVLWVVLAVSTAWRIPRGLGIRLRTGG